MTKPDKDKEQAYKNLVLFAAKGVKAKQVDMMPILIATGRYELDLKKDCNTLRRRIQALDTLTKCTAQEAEQKTYQRKPRTEPDMSVSDFPTLRELSWALKLIEIGEQGHIKIDDSNEPHDQAVRDTANKRRQAENYLAHTTSDAIKEAQEQGGRALGDIQRQIEKLNKAQASVRELEEGLDKLGEPKNDEERREIERWKTRKQAATIELGKIKEHDRVRWDILREERMKLKADGQKPEEMEYTKGTLIKE